MPHPSADILIPIAHHWFFAGEATTPGRTATAAITSGHRAAWEALS